MGEQIGDALTKALTRRAHGGPTVGPRSARDRLRRMGTAARPVSAGGYGERHGCPHCSFIRQGPAVLPLYRVRLDHREVARPLSRMPGLGHRRGDGRARGADHRRPAGSRRPRCRSVRSTDGRRPRAAPAWTSWTASSEAGSCPAPWCCSPHEPGVGKSTLLLDVAAKASSDEHRTLYVTGEESASQVRLRADRIKALSDHLYLAAETDLSAVLGHLDAVKPSSSSWTPYRPSPRPRSTARPAAWPRCARWPGP